MSNIKKYTIDHDWKVSIEVEIDHDVMIEEKLHQVNNFWSDSEYRLNKHGSVLNAVLVMLIRHALLTAISSDLNAYDIVCKLDWSDGNGQEGWPPMDGSEGIKITDINTSGIFDPDDMTIKVARAWCCRIPITFHSERFSLCINKEYTMQYTTTRWPVTGCPSESLLERVAHKLRGGWRHLIGILNQPGVSKNGSDSYGYPD